MTGEGYQNTEQVLRMLDDVGILEALREGLLDPGLMPDAVTTHHAERVSQKWVDLWLSVESLREYLEG